MKTIAFIWDTMGNILHRCESLEEAEELIEECDYLEMTRTYNDREVNIGVLNY